MAGKPYSVHLYRGDFGIERISERTLKAYGLSSAILSKKTWRRSSSLREAYDEMQRDIAAVQRYRWKRDDEEEEL